MVAETAQHTVELNNVRGPHDIFGALVKIAMSILNPLFLSDLYRDAVTLQSEWTEDAMTLYWLVTPETTFLTKSRVTIDNLRHLRPIGQAYCINITRDKVELIRKRARKAVIAQLSM